MRQYTDLTILLDRSGSMSSIKNSMESAFDEFLVKHREVPTTRITLVQFDSQNSYDVQYENVPIGLAGRLNLQPRGMTPLLDAFCTTIDATGKRLANMSESERPDQVLFVVITDGQENASREFKRYDVKNRVTKQSNDYHWQFVYLGANQDTIAEAQSFGIKHDWALNYAATAAGSGGALRSLTSNSFKYAASAGNDRGDAAILDFSDDQRNDANGVN